MVSRYACGMQYRKHCRTSDYGVFFITSSFLFLLTLPRVSRECTKEHLPLVHNANYHKLTYLSSPTCRCLFKSKTFHDAKIIFVRVLVAHSSPPIAERLLRIHFPCYLPPASSVVQKALVCPWEPVPLSAVEVAPLSVGPPPFPRKHHHLPQQLRLHSNLAGTLARAMERGLPTPYPPSDPAKMSRSGV